MKGKYEKSERRGLPGGPNEMFTYTTGIFSTQGYKRDSPDVDNPFNIIPSGDITMKGVDFPVLGTDNLGNSKMMTPGNDYKFPGDMVFELPMAKDGLALDPPPEKKQMVNLHDFLITEKDLEFLNSNRCFRGNCLENTKKAFDATAGSILGIPYTANVWGKDDLDITSIKKTPTAQQVKDFKWMRRDKGYGAADSWDIQGNIVRAEGKILYNRNKEGAKIESDDKEIDDPTGKFQPGQYPIGSIYSFGPKGTADTPYQERKEGFNIDYGLQPSHHSVMSVGVNEKGEIILYDAYLKKYDTEENIIKQIANSTLDYELETVGVPKSYANLTPENIKKSDNFHRPRYFTEYQFDVDRLDEIRQDPKFRIKEGDDFRAPRLDKEAMREFSQSLKDNKETMMEALRLTSDEYDDLANLSIALAMGESEGGGGLSVDWAGSTQGLTQLNFDNIKDDEVLSRQLAMFNESVRGPQKIKQLADLRDPAKSAIATLIYTNAGRRRSSKLHEEGLEPGVRNFYDNTGLKDLVRSSSSRINRSGVYLDELNDRVSFSDIPGWNEKNVKKITTSLNALTGTNRYQADIDDDGDVYIKMKTLGNDPNMSDAMKIGYWWQSPSSLKTGDAQGGNVHAKRIEGYYKAISEKTPEVSTDKLMASNTEIPQMQKAGELKADTVDPYISQHNKGPEMVKDDLAWLQNWMSSERFNQKLKENLVKKDSQQRDPKYQGWFDRLVENTPEEDVKIYTNKALQKLNNVQVFGNPDYTDSFLLSEEYAKFYDESDYDTYSREQLSHGQYSPSEHTIWLNKNDIGVNTHELVHSTDLDNLLASITPQAEEVTKLIDKYKKEYPDKENLRLTYDWISGTPMLSYRKPFGFFNTITTPLLSGDELLKDLEKKDFDPRLARYINKTEEVYPRVMSIRRRAGLKPEDHIDAEKMKEILQRTSDDDLYKVYSPEQVRVLLNELASISSNEDYSNLAKNGGSLPKAQPGRELKPQDLVPRDPFSTLSPAQREAFNASTVAAMKAEEERRLQEYMRRSPGGDLFPDQGLKPITYNEEVAGWFPVAGEYIDAKNTGEALMRGDYVDAGFNAAGFLLPFIPGSFLKKLATSPYTPKFSKPSLLKQYRSKFPAADIRGAGTGDYSNLGIDELGLRGDDFTSLTNYERSAISQVNQAQAADDVFNTFVQRYADFNTDDALANQLADFSRKNPRTKFEMNLGKDATPSKRMQEIFDDPELNIHNVFSLESPGPTTVKNTYTGYYDKRFYDGSAHDPSGEWDKNLRSYGQQGFYATNVPTGKPVRQSLTHTNRRGELFDYKIETVPVADYMVNKGLMNPDNIVNLGRHRGLDPANQHNHLVFDTDKPSVIVSGNRGFAGLSGGNTSRMQMGRVGIPKPNRNVPSYNTEILPLLKQEFNLSRPFEGTFMKLPRSRTTYYNSKGEASKYINDRQLDSDIFFTRKNGGSLPKAQEGTETYKVKSGDTFLGIANRLEIPREDFIEANPDINIDKLSLGQKLNIPVKKPYVPTNDVIPSEMLWRQAFAESNWETDVENKGGYKGLGQIGDDVITDYKKAFKVKEVDPFDPVQNSTIHKWYMNKLYNSEWINKPNQDPNVRLAKALAAYNWGPKTARKWFTDQRKAGVDIYNSFDWLEDLPSEPKGYIDMIIFNKNTPTRKYVEDLAKAMTDTTLTNQITNLYKRAGGEMNKLEMYKGYINGEFDGTDLEPKAQKVYDRMNRVYYAPAKKAGMSPPNFIMTNIIPRQLQTVL